MSPIPSDQDTGVGKPRPARWPIFRLERGWLTDNKTGMRDRQFECALQQASAITRPVRRNHPQPNDVIIRHPPVRAIHVAAELEACESPGYPIVPAQHARLPGESREEKILWTGLGQPLLFHVGHVAQSESWVASSTPATRAPQYPHRADCGHLPRKTSVNYRSVASLCPGRYRPLR
jgi:hypothetical protein